MHFDKFKCKHCMNFETFSIIKFARHIKKEHNKKLTKSDWKFIFKWHIISQFIQYLLVLPTIIILIILYFISYPFWWIKERIDIGF